jgi:hypothetical protein
LDLLRVALHARNEGGQIRVECYRNKGWVGKLLRHLCDLGLFECVDWNACKPRGGKLESAKPRAFLPTFRLLRAAADVHREVLTYAEFKQDRPGRRRKQVYGSTVQVLPGAAPISSLIVERLCAGSGLRMRHGMALKLIETQLIDQSDRRNKFHALLRSTGNQQEELHAGWEQKEHSHRIYSRLCGIPVVTRPALQALESQLPVWTLDYSQFEAVIFQSLCGESVRDGDLRGYCLDAVKASGTGVFSEKDVKRSLNALLHGQTKNHILFGAEDRHEAERLALLHELLLGMIREAMPNAFVRLQAIQRDPVLLQRTGAKIFYEAYHAALAATGVRAGIPLHDGWILPAKEEQARQAQALWQGIGRAALGIPTQAKLAAAWHPGHIPELMSSKFCKRTSVSLS